MRWTRLAQRRKRRRRKKKKRVKWRRKKRRSERIMEREERFLTGMMFLLKILIGRKKKGGEIQGTLVVLYGTIWIGLRFVEAWFDWGVLAITIVHAKEVQCGGEAEEHGKWRCGRGLHTSGNSWYDYDSKTKAYLKDHWDYS